ncbi:3-hydroxyacyl-CoA dehydrogenase [Salinarchaeum sp. Harcht-Bsk1]|uniref:3-hydroxyacyl-CoA dehydrogenase/enoyl-CoA hydratase family protein n=1 Tax=Salinarchaeum sp. Harcht-Bsk1 TaxID=1333523 RepID=UPI00034243C9|nr:3-hydroxyacyl-CoA dehydrogenase/enoyl-CoA hydratase family protein [Salinarchaeum sp. Harcht-Bsk1]AGN02924.1 3-hydroxyacyl-CoA dehydrogenase [Salinarchaeum sp. Harcht-Bsk1]
MEFEEINSIAVLGAGNMGHGIAEVAAMAGYEVTMRDIEEDLVQDGYDSIEWSLNKLAEKDQLTQEEADAALDRVTPVVDLGEAVGDVDVVIEAVPEVMDIKKEVYDEVEAHAPADAIFATNTSSLSITELSEVTDRPEQFCGMHFFNPPVRMQLVEVISGAHTSGETLDTIEELAEDFGKTPVRVRKDSPGFIVNRIAVPQMNEAAWLVHEGEATIAEVDSTTKHDVGLPMGAFELSDMVGLDVSFDVLEYVNGELGKAYEPCPILEEKVEAGELGQKTGKGFYDYEDGDGVQIPRDEGREDLEAILLAVAANEAAKLVGEDVADPAEIDEAVMLGLGWPNGPAKLADEYGVDELVDALDEWHDRYDHPRYEAADPLREIAEDGGFYGGDDSNDDAMEYETIAVSVEDAVGHIEIDRPHRMNTITVDMLDEIDAAMSELETHEDVRAVLITGAGDRAFSAGFDASTAAAGSGIQAQEMSRKGQQAFGRFEESPMPVLAAIDGYCLGGGMELATGADLRIASEGAQFGQPEHNLGLLPGWGGTQRLREIVGEGRAKEIIFTARDDYSPDTMYDYDFVNEVVAPDEFEDRAWELARDLASGPPIAQKFTKFAMHAGRDDTDAGLEVENFAFGHLFTTDDMWEGLAAFQEDREPEFTGE